MMFDKLALGKGKVIFVALAVVVLFATSQVSALAIGLGSSFNAYPGEVVERNFNIQNKGEDTANVEVALTVEKGVALVELVGGNSYAVNADGLTIVPVRIRVPTGAVVGESYEIQVKASVTGTDDVGSGEGNVAFIEEARNSIDIGIVERQEIPSTQQPAQESQGSGGMLWLILGVIVLIGVVVVIVMRRGKGSSSASLSAATGMSMNESTAPPSDSTPSGKTSRK